jgi:hypothetical protein
MICDGALEIPINKPKIASVKNARRKRIQLPIAGASLTIIHEFSANAIFTLNSIEFPETMSNSLIKN